MAPSNKRTQSVGVKDVDQSDLVKALAAYLKRFVQDPMIFHNVLYNLKTNTPLSYSFHHSDKASYQFQTGSTQSKLEHLKNWHHTTPIGFTPDVLP